MSEHGGVGQGAKYGGVRQGAKYGGVRQGAKYGGVRQGAKYGGVCQSRSYWSHWRCHSRLFPDDGIETSDWVSDVVHSPPRAVGFDEGIAALDDVTVPGLMLAFGVAGDFVMYLVGVGVLGVRVELLRLGQRTYHRVHDAAYLGSGVAQSHQGGEQEYLLKSWKN
ncbi:hypothetical protein AAG570_012048 [Ranatra chinensis]|uniref:Uncharacterized protein n=1 Tax=Ranatra chinensis TaxID=642074 RepID=A0ABD0YW61_9HEMI